MRLHFTRTIRLLLVISSHYVCRARLDWFGYALVAVRCYRSTHGLPQLRAHGYHTVPAHSWRWLRLRVGSAHFALHTTHVADWFTVYVWLRFNAAFAAATHAVGLRWTLPCPFAVTALPLYAVYGYAVYHTRADATVRLALITVWLPTRWTRLFGLPDFTPHGYPRTD